MVVNIKSAKVRPDGAVGGIRSKLFWRAVIGVRERWARQKAKPDAFSHGHDRPPEAPRVRLVKVRFHKYRVRFLFENARFCGLGATHEGKNPPIGRRILV